MRSNWWSKWSVSPLSSWIRLTSNMIKFGDLKDKLYHVMSICHTHTKLIMLFQYPILLLIKSGNIIVYNYQLKMITWYNANILCYSTNPIIEYHWNVMIDTKKCHIFITKPWFLAYFWVFTTPKCIVSPSIESQF